MPNIKSAEKRVEIAQVRTARNKVSKTNLKTTLKAAESAIKDQTENKDQVVKLAVSKLDKSASKGLIHKNKAARKKSQLVKKAAVSQ